MFELIRIPFSYDQGIVDDNYIVPEMLKPFCTRKIYMGHLEVVQTLLTELFVVIHSLLYFSTKLSNFSSYEHNKGKIEQHAGIFANKKAIILE
jgi:hypothetical protein